MNISQKLFLFFVFITIGSQAALFGPVRASGAEHGHANYATPYTAQAGPSEEKLITPSFQQYFSGVRAALTAKENLLLLGTTAAMALTVRPFDAGISEDVKDDNFNELELRLPTILGHSYIILGGSAVAYSAGRLMHQPRLANTGLIMFEAVITTQAITFIGKKAFNRMRPDSSNQLSFPSGHASGMFAAASVLDKRYGWKVGIPSYLVAGYVGISRIKVQKHFPTDIIVGAALGTIIGRSFAQTIGKDASVRMQPMFFPGTAGLVFQISDPEQAFKKLFGL